MTRDRKNPIRVWVSEAERAEIKKRAESANLSLSAFARSAALNKPVRSVLDIDAVKELARINGDMGKNAELLKLCLTENHGFFVNPLEVKKRIDRFRELQDMAHQLMGRMLR